MRRPALRPILGPSLLEDLPLLTAVPRVAIRDDADALHSITLIAALAPRLGLELMAQGVEDRTVLSPLADLGIQSCQGDECDRP
jgi:hypothetical protein